MSRPNPHPVEVAIGLIERDGRYLVGRRPTGSHLAGAWEFPGGKRKDGEEWQDCLARELAEELGVRAEVEESLGVIDFSYPDCTVRLAAFRCRIVEGQPQPRRVEELRWVTLRELAGLPYPPANQPLIERLARLA